MKVDEILRAKGHEVVTTPRHASVARLCERLRQERIGALVVSADGRTVDGIVTEREIVHAIARHGAPALDMRAVDVMMRSVRTCTSGDRVRDVMIVMTPSARPAPPGGRRRDAPGHREHW